MYWVQCVEKSLKIELLRVFFFSHTTFAINWVILLIWRIPQMFLIMKQRVKDLYWKTAFISAINCNNDRGQRQKNFPPKKRKRRRRQEESFVRVLAVRWSKIKRLALLCPQPEVISMVTKTIYYLGAFFSVDFFFFFLHRFWQMRTVARAVGARENDRRNTEKLIKSSRDNFMIEINTKRRHCEHTLCAYFNNNNKISI